MLDYIHWYWRRHRSAPTQTGIAKHFGISQTRVWQQLHLMEVDGVITLWGGKPKPTDESRWRMPALVSGNLYQEWEERIIGVALLMLEELTGAETENDRKSLRETIQTLAREHSSARRKDTTELQTAVEQKIRVAARAMRKADQS